MRITSNQLRKIIMEEVSAVKRKRRLQESRKINLLKVRRQRAKRLKRERIFESKYGRRNRRLHESRYYGNGLLGLTMDVLAFKFKATLGILGIVVLVGTIQELRDSGQTNPSREEVQLVVKDYCDQNNIPETALETAEIDEICSIALDPDSAVEDYDAADVSAPGGDDFVPGGMSQPDVPMSDDL